MEIFGGFMVMMSIMILFLAVVWLIMPFVVFAIKGKQDRALELLVEIEKRLSHLEERLRQNEPAATPELTPAEGPAEAPTPGPVETAAVSTNTNAENI